jgi:RNA polymerase sigma-70 factor (ECF subfamily)
VLLARVGRGDRQAFSDLYDHTVVRVLEVIALEAVEPITVERIAQAAFLDVWRHAPLFDPATRDADRWILDIARAHAVSRAPLSRSMSVS